MKTFFGPKDVAEIIGLSYRQIQYWDKTNFIKPSYRRKGRFRQYIFSDMILLWVAKRLRDEGYSIQHIRTVIPKLRGILPQASRPTREMVFLIDACEIIVFCGEVLMDPERAKRYVICHVAHFEDHVYPPEAEAV